MSRGGHYSKARGWRWSEPLVQLWVALQENWEEKLAQWMPQAPLIPPCLFLEANGLAGTDRIPLCRSASDPCPNE